MTITGRNFEPGTTATFTLFSDPVVLGTAVVAADGTVTLRTTIPAGTAAGVHTVVITGTAMGGGAAEARVELTITAASAGGNGNLARTGAGTMPFLLGGVILLMVGGLAFFSRRRNSSHA